MKIVPQQYVSELEPYQAGMPIDQVTRKYGLRPKDIIKLASNENPLGMSPKAVAAVKRAMPNEGHLYPDQYALIHKLAEKLGVRPEHLVLGNGSNDILDLLARTFAGPGREGVTSRYAFTAHQIAIHASGGKNVVVADKDFGHDLEAMLAAITPDTGLISVVNPNNPTGTLLAPDELQDFIRRVPERVVIVLDEAYYEYLDHAERPDSIWWLSEYPNLVITRTFSKIYGLAGARVGYGVMSPEIADLLNRVRLPFNVNALGLTAALAALDDDDFIARSVTANNDGRKQLAAGLEGLGVAFLPVRGNFAAFKIGAKARAVHEGLLERGVILRGLAPYGMHEYLRVTIGTREQNERFLNALREVLAS